MTRVHLKVLRRNSEEFKVHPETWANVLLLASDHGWKPDRPTFFFLANGMEMSDANAAALVNAWDRLADQASTYLVKRRIVRPGGDVQEIAVELGVLSDIRNFCARGAFRIDEGPTAR